LENTASLLQHWGACCVTKTPILPPRRDVLKGIGASALAATTSLPARAAPSPTGPTPWQQSPTQAYRGKQDDIFFVDTSRGWYGNGAGKLFRTDSGGAAWELIKEQPGTFIRALGFANPDLGWIGNVGTDYYPGVTDKNPLYQTVDGGKTWTAVTAPGIEKVAGICGIHILEGTRIFQGELVPNYTIHAAGRVGGPAMMLRSTDSGATWRVIDLSAYAGMILDVFFHDAQNGFVCAASKDDVDGGRALILQTRDGGATWRQAYTGTRVRENCWKMSFPSRRVGYATVQSYSETDDKRIFIKTTNGGRSWREMPLVTDLAAREFGVGFATEQMGWIGTRQRGYETRDGGRTWAPVTMGEAVNKVRVVNGPDGRRKAVAIGVNVFTADL
jgi:photosystem II stability/assembly factor-like uncharacterized protein